MKTNKLTTFRVAILENDEKVIDAICNALNALANPDEHFGFKFSTNDCKFVISVSATSRKNVVPDFEVAFKVDPSYHNNFDALNTLFKKCILSFEYDKPKLVISIVDKYEHQFEDVVFEQYPGLEKNSCMFSMQKSVSHVDQVIQVLNVIRIKKFLTLSRTNLVISASGDNLIVTIKVNVTESYGSEVMFFISKFNFMSAQGLATYSFSIINIDNNIPKMFQIAVYIPQEASARAEFQNQMDLIDSISAFSKLLSL